jgi:hypothetical protein
MGLLRATRGAKAGVLYAKPRRFEYPLRTISTAFRAARTIVVASRRVEASKKLTFVRRA